jgi:hypothetical protein
MLEHRHTRDRSWSWSSLLVPALLAAVLSPAWAQGATLRGAVLSGPTPLASLVVALYATDPSHPHRCATALGAAPTAGDGSFEISYTAPADDDAVLYVTADGGSVRPGKLPKAGKCRRFAGPVVLASVLGTAGPALVPTDVVVDERTTVAAAYALAQFIDGPRIGGKARGLQNAAGMAQNLANATTGGVGETLATFPNGGNTETLGSFDSLANMVAACVASPAACTTLFDLAAPPRGRAPTDTLQALVDIARHPATSKAAVEGLYDLSLLPPAPYQPVRDPAVPPAAWTLALLFEGDGMTMDGPGNIAFDEAGSIWVNANYTWSPDPDAIVCGGKFLFHFTPTGEYVPGSPYTGGGIDGAGFGITLDPTGDVWVGNFGFASPGCPDKPPANSVSQFAPDGTPISPPTGFTNGGVDWPQGTVSDREGSIWIANCGNGTATKYPGGDPTAALQFVADPACGMQAECSKPFDIALNRKGWAFVTLNASSRVAVLRPDGTPLPQSPLEGVFDRPMGIAADSRGNMWVSNSETLRVPCPGGFLNPQSTDGSIAMIRRDARATKGPFTGGGLTIPWGIAVDGDDNVWVANFFEQRLSHFCGRNPRACPPGAETGSPISPEPGYAFDGLTRNTGVQVDRSGNVWLVNNWKNMPNPLGNPGGYQIVAFVGLAPPIATPLIGPPTRP